MKKHFSFQWHLTDLCNLRCKHCYQTTFDKNRDLSLEDNLIILQNIVDNLTKRGYDSLNINLTGGEPLMSNLTYELLENIKNQARFTLIKDINIITNGLFTDKLGSYINHPLLKYIKISLEGPNKQINDVIRGDGVFDQVMENLKRLPLERVIFMFTLAKYNYRYLAEMFRLSRIAGVKGLILERFIPLGRGKNIAENALNAKQWEECLGFIARYFQMSVSDLLPYKAFWIDLKAEECFGAICNLGNESMCLMPDGVVYPCRRLPEILGNLRIESFAEILDRLTNFRNQFDNKTLKGKCRFCHIADCIGCRANALAIKQDIFAEDNQCFLSNQE